MNDVKDAQLSLQITMIPILAEAWNMPFTKLSDFLKEYHILEYLAASPEYFNSMGTQGIVEELEEYVTELGGKIIR